MCLPFFMSIIALYIHFLFYTLQMIAPQNTEIPAKTSINGKERGIMKRLKGFDGLAVSSNNADAEDAGGSANKRSQRCALLELQLVNCLCCLVFMAVVKTY